jgi:hypothetical protein
MLLTIRFGTLLKMRVSGLLEVGLHLEVVVGEVLHYQRLVKMAIDHLRD